VKVKDLMDKKNSFSGALPFSSWAMFVTWLHLGALQENLKKFNK
jgi:hypothetical protein